ncbi:hypothetical protein ABIB25_004670 [Nakamurella sp. UYEF19]|uniref:hypothetical protein n=1 Tax=Nakamurella sp. UYEF19 TaxID=1756392 RepID=UPI0033908563
MSGPADRPSRPLLVVALLGALLVGGCTTVVAGEAAKAPATAAASVPSTVSTTDDTVAVAPTSPTTSTTPATTPDQDRPQSASPTTKPLTTAPTSVSPYDLQVRHDAAFEKLLASLAAGLRSGDRKKFLAPFAPSLNSRVGHWFSNTRALGVAAVKFAPSQDYSSGATDSVSSLTRTLVLGVRTPYDDDDSMPGIVYSVGARITTRAGVDTLTITSWQPKYLGDPMNCDCTLKVVNHNNIAVVADAADGDLVYWSDSALQAADRGISWSSAQLAGTGLVVPKGQVIFLADKPFHWFLSLDGTGQQSNVTAGLVDADGDYPGTRYSDQSRIVLMLQSADGSVVPNDREGRQYATDVITHESTHQLMNRNSSLPSRNENSPPTWVAEGIAVAVETLYRDSLGDSADVDYPEPNDPKNTSSSWYTEHLTDGMPTKAQLYSSSSTDGSGYYAIAGSVFRYLEREDGYLTMMQIAALMYLKPAQTPFDFFPDPDHPGQRLPAATAKSRWKAWFVDNYEN